jgi:hypothetical protein
MSEPPRCIVLYSGVVVSGLANKELVSTEKKSTNLHKAT